MKKAILLLAASLGLAAAPGVLAQVTLTINTETPTTFSATISGTLTADAGGIPYYLAIKPNYPASEGVNVPWITSYASTVTDGITLNGAGFDVYVIPNLSDVTFGDCLFWETGAALTTGTTINGTVTITGTFDYSQVTSFALCDGYNVTTQDWNALVVATSSSAAAPSITTQPSNMSVESGNSTNFTVTATGSTPLYYQWQFNSNNISGANDDTYALAAADVADAGYYDVVITNAFGSVTSSVVTLAVTPATPTVDQWPTASTITYGQPLSASSLTDGSAGVDGSFAFATPTSFLNAGSPSEWVVFTPTDTNNYDVVSNTVEVTVSPALLTVTATSETIFYGGSFPAFTGTLVGVTNNDNLTVSFYTPAGAQSGAGTYQILPVFNDPNGVLPNYVVTTNVGQLLIQTAPLGVTANNQSRIYGATNPIFNLTYTGLAPWDTAASLTTAPVGATAATVATTIGQYPITVSGGVSPNYNFSYTNGTLTITPAPLTVTANSTNRLYGQDNPVFAGSLVGVANGDNITPNYGSTATAASAVGTYAIVPTLTDPSSKLGNYAVTTNNGTLTVGNATLTVSAASQTRNYGQANAAFTVNYSGFVNSQDASVVSGTPSFVCVDGNGVNVGPATPVGVYAIIPSGLTAPNYTLVYANGSVTINQATLTVTPNAATRTYGATNPVFAATFTGFANSETTNVISGQSALSTTAGLTSPVGGYPITAALGTLSATNYNFAFNTGTLTVGAAPLAGLVQSWERAYGQTNPVFTVAYSGFVNGETTNLVAGGIGYSCLDSNDVPVGTNTWVGTYGITVGTPQTAPNYAITYPPGSLEVTQAVLIVSADPQGKAFGATNPPLTYTLSGFVNDDGTNVVSGAPELSTSAVTNSPVGTYAIDISQGTLSATNYSFSLTNGWLTVVKATLTVTADNHTRLYGQTNPVLTVQYSGFVDGEGQSILSGSPAVTTAAGTNTGVGSYAITVGTGTLVASNYALNLVGGTLAINPTPLGITAQNATRQYGSNNPVFEVTYTGLVNNENGSVLAGTLTLTSATDPATDVGTYAIVPAGVTSTNYAISFTNGTLTIMSAPLTVTANNTNRLYGQANPAFTGSLVGVANGDNITPNYGSTATAASAVGTYAIVPTLTDPSSKLGNYAVTTNNGTLTVGNATLTVMAASQTRNYGQANAAFTVNYSGFVNSQDASVVSGTPSFVCVDGNAVNVGPATPVGVYAIIPGGLTAPNYTLVYANGSVTINQATLTVTPNAATRTYGATNPVFAATFTGFANSETTNVISGQSALSTTAGLTSPVGGYPITAALGTLSATNYNFAFNTGTLTVGTAPLAGLVQSWERAYGQTNPVFKVAYSGFVNGETTNLVAGGIVYSCLDSNDVPVGTNTWVGTYGITVSTPQTAPNYTITYSPGSLVVTQAVLMVSADPQGKAFGATNPPLTYTLSGFVNDDGTNVVSGAPELSTSVVTNSPVGTYAIDISQGTLSATNYSFSLTNGVLTVAHALLTVTAVNQTRLYGQTNPVLTVQYSGFVDGDDQGILSGSPAVTTSAATNTGVGSYAITVGTGTLVAPNYALNLVNGTLTINPTPLGITAQNATRQYGSNNPVFGVVYTGLVNNENGSALAGTLTLTSATDPATDVGTYAIVPAGVTSTNYAISFTNGTLTIMSAPLTVTANNTNRLYGQANPAFTGSLVGVANGDNITPNYGSTATAASAVGTYAIVPTLTDPSSKLGNYAVTTNNGTLTVGNATLTVMAASQTRNYGQANAAFTVNYSGFVNSQDASVVSGTPSFVCVDGNAVNVGPATPVGVYAIIPGGLTAPNYTLVYANGSVTINQATLTVTPNAATRTYGATNPVFAATFTGFANSETTNVISGQSALSTTAGLTSPVGGYPITAALGTLSATNYNFAFNTGTLTVGTAPLAGLVQSWERAYGQTNPVFKVAYSGFVNGETTNLVAGGIVYSCLDSNDVPVGTNTWVGTYGITVSTPQTAPNYTITYSPGSLVVTQAVLMVSADPQGKAFGATNPPLTYTLSGFVNDDGTNVVSGAPELSTSVVTNSPVGTYAIDISQGTLSATNYSFSLTNGVLTVAHALLTVTAVNQTRLYGQTNPVLTVQYSGFVDGDDQGILSGSPAVTTSAATNTGVGSYAITVGTGTLVAPNYALNLVNGTLTINPTPLGITAQNATRQYGSNNPVFGVVYTGLVNNENGSALAGTLTLTSATDPATDVGTYAIVPAGVTSTNYAISFTNGTLTIMSAPLTVTANNTNRLYGQANPAFTGSLVGVVNGDNITPNYGSTATAASAVGTYAIVPTLTDPSSKLGNYAVTTNNGTLTVGNATLTVMAASQTRNYGQANAAFTVNYSGFVNSQDASVVSGTPSFVCVDGNAVNVGPATPVGVYAIIPGGLTAPNYTLVYANGSVTINQATLTVTPNAATRTYGATNPVFAATFTGFANSETTNVISGQSALSTTAGLTSPVGGYPITAALGTLSATNYNFAFNTGTLTVGTAPLAGLVQSWERAYGQTNPVFKVAYSGFVNGETTNLVAGGIVYSCLDSNDVPVGTNTWVGTYGITVSTPQTAPNYTITYSPGSLVVTQAVLMVSADPQGKAFGATNPPLTYTLSGFVDDDGTNVVSGAPELSTSVVTNSPVGTYGIDISQGTLSATNYSFSLTNGWLTVAKATLTVTADNHTRLYGQTNPVLTVQYSGFVDGEGQSILSGSPAVTTAAGTNTGVGSYAITVGTGTLVAPNYALNLVGGTLAINPTPLGITAQNATRQYGSNNPVFEVTYTGLVNNENGSVLAGTLTLTSATDPATDVGTYAIVPAGVTSTNYAISFTNGTLTIMSAPLTVTANNTNRLYGQANPAFTGSLVGVVNGDNITPNYGSTATAASSVGTYAIVPTLTDPAAKLGNYAVTTNNGTLTVGNATLTVMAASQTRNYGQANAAFTVNYSGFVNSQDASVVSGTPSFVCVDGNAVNVGPATPVGVYAIIPSGLTAPNYTLVYANGSVTINHATLTVTPNAATRTYGATNPVLSATFTGFANSETTNVISGQSALSTTAGLTSPVGGYPITAALGTLRATNYNFAFNSGTLTVGTAPLAGLVQSWERAYGQTNPVFKVAYSGFVNGETTNLVAGGIAYSCLDSNEVPVGTNTWVGTYGITVGTPQTAPNYAITYSPGSLEVTQAVLMVSADPQGKAFGATNPPLTYTLSGFVNDDGTNVVSGAPELSTSVVTNSPVGTYAIDISQGTLSATNYSFSLTNGWLTVAKATLTVTADNHTRLYGQTNPVLTVQYSGFVDGEGQSILSGSPAVTTAAGTNTGVGSYAITVGTGTLVASNYALNLVGGTLAINPTPLGITAQNATRQYGSNNPVFEVTYTGLVNNENGSVLAGTLTLTSAIDPASEVGTYPIVPAGLTATNYAISFTNGTLLITPAPLTVVANNAIREYGALNPAFTGSITGLYNGDPITATYATTATAGSPVGTYAIVPSLVDPDNKVGDYDVTLVSGVLTVTLEVNNPYGTNVTGYYVVGDVPSPINTNALVGGGSLNYNGGTLVVTILTNGTAEDELTVDTEGMGAGEIDLSGTNVTYGGTTIASLAGGVGTEPLQFVFNAEATTAAVSNLLRQVSFYTSNTNTAFRTLELALTVASNTVVSYETLIVDRPPVTGVTVLTAAKGATLQIPFSLILTNDYDVDGDPLTITDYSDMSTNGAWITNTGTALIYTPSAIQTNNDLFAYIVSDGRGGSTVGIVNLEFLVQNELKLTTSKLAANGVHLTMVGVSNHNYLIQATTNFITWANLGTVTADSLGGIQFQDTTATNYVKRFYRAEEQ